MRHLEDAVEAVGGCTDDTAVVGEHCPMGKLGFLVSGEIFPHAVFVEEIALKRREEVHFDGCRHREDLNVVIAYLAVPVHLARYSDDFLGRRVYPQVDVAGCADVWGGVHQCVSLSFKNATPDSVFIVDMRRESGCVLVDLPVLLLCLFGEAVEAQYLNGAWAWIRLVQFLQSVEQNAGNGLLFAEADKVAPIYLIDGLGRHCRVGETKADEVEVSSVLAHCRIDGGKGRAMQYCP